MAQRPFASAQIAFEGETRIHFVARLWDLVTYESLCHNLCWQPGGDGFQVKNVEDFTFFIRTHMSYNTYEEFTSELADWGFERGRSPRTNASLFHEDDEVVVEDGTPMTLCCEEKEDAFQDEPTFETKVDAQERAPELVAETYHHPRGWFCHDDHNNAFVGLRSMTRKKRRKAEREAKKKPRTKGGKESRRSGGKEARRINEKPVEETVTATTVLTHSDSPPNDATVEQTTTASPRKALPATAAGKNLSSTFTTTTEEQKPSSPLAHVGGSTTETAEKDKEEHADMSEFQPRTASHSLDDQQFNILAQRHDLSPLPLSLVAADTLDSDEGIESVRAAFDEFKSDKLPDEEAKKQDAFDSSRHRLEDVLKNIADSCDPSSRQVASYRIDFLVKQLEELLASYLVSKTSSSSSSSTRGMWENSAPLVSASVASSTMERRAAMKTGGPKQPVPLHNVYHGRPEWEANRQLRNDPLVAPTAAKTGQVVQRLQYVPAESADMYQSGAGAYEPMRMRTSGQQAGGFRQQRSFPSTSVNASFGADRVPPPSLTSYVRGKGEPYGPPVQLQDTVFPHSYGCLPRGLPEVDHSNADPIPPPLLQTLGGSALEGGTCNLGASLFYTVEATATTVSPTGDEDKYSLSPRVHLHHHHHRPHPRQQQTLLHRKGEASFAAASSIPSDEPKYPSPHRNQATLQHPLLQQTQNRFSQNNEWFPQWHSNDSGRAKFAAAASSSNGSPGWRPSSHRRLLDHPLNKLVHAQASDEEAPSIYHMEQAPPSSVQQSPKRLIQVMIRVVLLKPVRLLTKRSPSLPLSSTSDNNNNKKNNNTRRKRNSRSDREGTATARA